MEAQKPSVGPCRAHAMPPVTVRPARSSRWLLPGLRDRTFRFATDRSEVNEVLQALVLERDEFVALDPLDEVALEDQVVIAESEEVSPVHAVWGRCQPEEKRRREMLDQLSIARR